MDENLMQNKLKIVVIGAGPVGSLAALYAAERGYNVEIYELRDDLRNKSTTPLNFTKSINLALSERGINALRHSQRSHLVDRILNETIPMKARMIHGRDKSGSLYEESQDYDIHGKTIFAVDRNTLNTQLLDELETFPNVKLIFNHKLIGIDFKSHEAKLKNVSHLNTESLQRDNSEVVEVKFDLLIGADGAHSSTRQHMMKLMCMNYSQTYIDTLWCEFTIKARNPPSEIESNDSRFRISADHLHIWPGKEYMFIAIPSLSGDFVCTLFAPSYIYQKLSHSSEELLEFFHESFPGVTPDLIPPTSLIESFNQNPHLPLISIKCSPHHFQDSAVILGDATHAMVPFYGQGMNAGFEDVRVLYQTLDKVMIPYDFSPKHRALALEQYSALRIVDSEAISRLALENYQEMRSSVTSYKYKSRKWLEEKLSLWVPSLGWKTKYSRVSFGNERYSEVVRKSELQGVIINRLLQGVEFISLGGAIWGLFKLRRVFTNFLLNN